MANLPLGIDLDGTSKSHVCIPHSQPQECWLYDFPDQSSQHPCLLLFHHQLVVAILSLRKGQRSLPHRYHFSMVRLALPDCTGSFTRVTQSLGHLDSQLSSLRPTIHPSCHRRSHFEKWWKCAHSSCSHGIIQHVCPSLEHLLVQHLPHGG